MPKDLQPATVQRQVVLILDDDSLVTEGLSVGLEGPGRTIITCNDLQSAQIIVETLEPSHIVADVRLTGAFAFEGLDFIGYAKRHSPHSRVIMMTGDAPEALQMEASQRGAVGFLQKPFGGLQLGALIDLMSFGLSADSHPPVMIRMPDLDEILTSANLYTVFQPIVKLGAIWEPFAYESLARYRTNSPLRDPSVLFDYANRKMRIHELEFECIRRTVTTAATALSGAMLFVNIHPTVLSSGNQLVQVLAGVDPSVLQRMVLEITEHAALSSTPETFAAFDEIRALGVRFAFDDFGVGHSHLPVIGRVLPSFLKISQNFGTGFETDPTKVKIVSSIVSIANAFGCQVILEGVEEASTAQAAVELGIELGQGYFFGRPAEASDLTPEFWRGRSTIPPPHAQLQRVENPVH